VNDPEMVRCAGGDVENGSGGKQAIWVGWLAKPQATDGGKAGGDFSSLPGGNRID
jgi:hypothetical protein